MQLQTSNLRAPFIVSVTGHKDIIETDERDLENAFIAQLDALEKEAQEVEKQDKKLRIKEWILLSALAEGADTLAARVALDKGWKVIAPLPLPLDEYRKDFKSEALKKFNELLDVDKCPNFFIGYAPGCNKDNTVEYGEFRDRQYAYLGEFLTRHCEVLIAFWDGNDAGGIGGTGYVVNLQREGLAGYSIELRDDGTLLDPPEIGRTFAIWSKRAKHGEADAKFRSIAGGNEKHGTSDELPHGGDDGKQGPKPPAVAETQLQRWQQQHQQWRQKQRETRETDQEMKRREKYRAEWEEFVREANRLEEGELEDGKIPSIQRAQDEQRNFKTAQDELAAANAAFEATKTASAEQQVEAAKAKVAEKTPEYQALPLDLAKRSEYLAGARDAFLRADALAERYQSKALFAFYATMAVVLAFTLCVAGADAYAQSRGVITLASWALLAGAYGISQWQKKSDDANRHQDYRALAEAWRVAFFWRALGIEAPLDTCYLRSQRGELDWIRHALRTADLEWRAPRRDSQGEADGHRKPNPCGYPQPEADDFEVVLAGWIGDQKRYFAKKVPQSRVELTSWRNWSWALLILGLTASALELLAQIQSAQVAGAAGAWQGLLSDSSAELLASPFVPALLLAFRMNSWPVATDKNTQKVRADTAGGEGKRRKLRHWFVLQSAAWTFGAIGGGLLALGAAALLIVGILPSAENVPLLKMLATLCFFLPSLIYVAAEHNALPEQVTNFERMSAIFDKAEKMLKQLNENTSAQISDCKDAEKRQKIRCVDADKARRIYAELGREALHENGEWLITHRERPLDVGI